LSKLNIVILAAGLGKRMHSALPKVLHPLAGKPLVGNIFPYSRAGGGRESIEGGIGAERTLA